MSGLFFERVYKLVKKIPKGRVATYGQVAALLGTPRAAQAVGWALAVCDSSTVPWQRVVGRDGWLTIVNEHLPADLQAAMLKREGLKLVHHDNLWQIKNFPEALWRPRH